jgi:hypothetical protein
MPCVAPPACRKSERNVYVSRRLCSERQVVVLHGCANLGTASRALDRDGLDIFAIRDYGKTSYAGYRVGSDWAPRH